MKTVAVKITDNDYRWLKKIADYDGRLLSEILRIAIRKYIKERREKDWPFL